MPRVKVYVDAEGNVSVNKDPMYVGKTRGSVTIKWKMQSEGWEITNITDPQGNPLPAGEFKKSRKDNADWKIKDMNYKIGDYEYVIHVQQIETGECMAHDPVIRNGGRK